MKSSVVRLVKADWYKDESTGIKLVTINFEMIETVNKLLVETNEIITDICTVHGSINFDANRGCSYSTQAFIWSLVCMSNGKVKRMFSHETAEKMLTEEYVDSKVNKAVDYVIDIKDTILGQEEWLINMYQMNFSF